MSSENSSTPQKDVESEIKVVKSKTNLDELSEAEVRKRQMYNIYILSWGCCFVVCGLKLIGSFGTALLGSFGATSLSLLYYGGAIAFIIGPSIMNLLPSSEFGLRIIGPEYAIYILSFVYYIPAFCLTWSAIHGVAASIFWTCQVTVLKANSTVNDVGRKSGIFWAIYMAGSIVGNLVAYYVLNVLGYETQEGQTGWLGGVSIMFSIFVISSILGAVFFWFFKPIPKSYRPQPPPSSTFMNRLKLVMKSFAKPRILCVLPIAAAWGFELPFMNSMFNRQILQKSIIGLITAFISFIEVLFSFITGPIMDLLGVKYAMILTTVSMLIGLIISYFACLEQNWLLYLACFFFAVADTGYQTILPVLITHYKDEVIANAAIRFTANVIGGICYNLAPLFLNDGETRSSTDQYLWEIILTAIITILGQLSYMLYHYLYPIPESVEFANANKNSNNTLDKDLKKELEMITTVTVNESSTVDKMSGINNSLSTKQIDVNPTVTNEDVDTTLPTSSIVIPISNTNEQESSSQLNNDTIPNSFYIINQLNNESSQQQQQH